MGDDVNVERLQTKLPSTAKVFAWLFGMGLAFTGGMMSTTFKVSAYIQQQEDHLNSIDVNQVQMRDQQKEDHEQMERLTNAVHDLQRDIRALGGDSVEPQRLHKKPQSFLTIPRNQGYDERQDSVLPPDYEPQTSH